MNKPKLSRIYLRAFSRGVGSIFSLSGNYFPAPDLSHPEIKDREAMKSDWEAVGGYLWQAIDQTKLLRFISILA